VEAGVLNRQRILAALPGKCLITLQDQRRFTFSPKHEVGPKTAKFKIIAKNRSGSGRIVGDLESHYQAANQLLCGRSKGVLLRVNTSGSSRPDPTVGAAAPS
jgi:hypothetical protein